MTSSPQGSSASSEGPFDLIVHAGRVADGSGAPARPVDVAVRDGRIAAIGEDLAGQPARRRVDAAGRIVAPGFVDVHSHADLILLSDAAIQRRLLGAKLRQGVTTLVVGNCGLGVAPSTPDSARLLAGVNAWMTPDGATAGALSVGGYLDRLARDGVVLNAGALVPHGAVRASVMGLDRGAPSADQLDAMRAVVARALDEGALGMSAGLIYPPGMYSATEELVALAAEAARRDRPFTCHVRGSSELLLPATLELVEIARRSGAHCHHSHLEAVGERFWPDVARALAIEDRARAEGLRISHDVFVYTRAATMMSAIFPPWALEGGLPSLLGRLRDPDDRERIRREVERRVPEWPPWAEGGWPHNLVEAVGWDGIIVASVRPGGPAEWVGRDLATLAASRSRDPFEIVADLMLSQDGQVGQLVAGVSGTDDRPEPLLSIFEHPAAAIISDAEDYGRGSPHPAHAGAFARALRLARERGRPGLEDVVRRMTSYPASLLGIRDRGMLREGAAADVVVFDAASVSDRATWEAPREAARGIECVIVNGRVVVEDGRLLDRPPAGRVLRAGA